MDQEALFGDDPPPGPEAVRELPTDSSLDRVADWFSAQPAFHSRIEDILRQSIDEVLDGQRTGRYDIEQLAKTEKTYLGTKVEIVLQAEFGLTRGQHMDYSVEGEDVDCKFSLSFGGWTIPREAVGQICLIIHADDRRSRFSAGLVRADSHVLSAGTNQDGKKRLAPAGRETVRWLVRDGALPENLLLNLSAATREGVLHGTGRRDSGQARVNRLFRLVRRRLIRREVVLAVGKQDDAPKRVRDARNHLRSEGILILGHQGQHPRIADDLRIAVPTKGSWISVRVVPLGEDTSEHLSTCIGGVSYALAEGGQSACPAPERY